MEAIGDAIEQSAGLIAVISQKYVKSTYCNDEMVMAKSSGLQIFPLLFRDMTFEALPSRMKYMLVSLMRPLSLFSCTNNSFWCTGEYQLYLIPSTPE